MKDLRWLIACLLLFLILSSCGKKVQISTPVAGLPSVDQADPNGRLILSLGGEPSVLNPILSTDTASSGVENYIFEGLVRIDKNLNIIPALAESWDTTDGGKLWTFHLRKDVLWHDGAPFTAMDVKFTFDKVLDPRTNTVRRELFMINGQPIEFKVIDKYTIQAVLPEPFAPFLLNAGIGILPKHILEKQNVNFAAFNRKPIGTGPFVFYEWKAADHLTLLANQAYYRGAPKLAALIFKINPTQETAMLALRNKEVDVAGIQARRYEEFKQYNHLNVYDHDDLFYIYVGLNLDKPCFADKLVRQAMAYAVNKEQMVQSIFQGLAQPAYAPDAPLSWAYEPEVKKYEFSPDKAKALLKKAGYVMNEKKQVLEKDGIALRFTLLMNQGSPDAEKAALILQQYWQDIGIKMDIQIMEWSSLLKIINAPVSPKNFDAVMIGWSLGLDPDSYSIWHSSQFPKGFNYIHYDNPKVDLLLEKGRTTIDKESRRKIYSHIYKLIADDQPYIFLWYPKVILGINKRVGGYEKPSAAGTFLYPEKVFVVR